MNPHPTSDFQVIDIATSGLGLKSRLPIDNPGVWLGSGVGRAFTVPNPNEVVGWAVITSDPQALELCSLLA